MTAIDLPLPGPHTPAATVIARRAGSVRRTSTIDTFRNAGLLGPTVVDARARDLVTGADGEIAGRTEQRVQLDIAVDRTISRLVADPDDPALAALAGVSVASRFRIAAMAAVPEHMNASTLLYLLLDDLPGASHVSGFAFGHAAQTDHEMRQMMLSVGPISGTPDLCAGWVEGGGIMTFLRREGIPPVLTGPAAPSLAAADDPEAWHDRPALTPHGMRRARMLDVWRDGDAVRAHSLFRDSHVSVDGDETVVHEYSVDATLDDDGTIAQCTATIGVLPWVECPRAVASAEWVVGTSARVLRERVRRTFKGTSTCTHLNDQLRSLEDVPALADRLT